MGDKLRIKSSISISFYLHFFIICNLLLCITNIILFQEVMQQDIRMFSAISISPFLFLSRVDCSWQVYLIHVYMLFA